MLPHLDTYSDALRIERDLALKRATRQAPLLEAVKQARPSPKLTRVEPMRARRASLADVLRSLRAVLRPARV